MPPKGRGRGKGRAEARGGATTRQGARAAAREAVSESVHDGNSEQVNAVAAAAAAQEDVRAAEHAAVLEELQRYQTQFGNLGVDPVGGVGGVDAPPHEAPNVAAPVHRPPPPPPPPVQAHGWQITYWEAMGHMKSMVRCPFEYRKDLAVQYLKEEALVWWEGVTEKLRYELNYDDFKNEFMRKYFSREMMNKINNEFKDISQGNRDVRQYEAEFNRLRRFAGRYLDEEDLIRRFLKGMRVELRNRCMLKEYMFLEDLVETAAQQELGLEEDFKQNKSVQAKTGKRSWDTASAGPSTTPIIVCKTCGKRHLGTCRNDITCFKCNQRGHYQKECPANGQVRGCYRCGKTGHIARDCIVRLPGQQQGDRNREQLPPPPKRQAVAPRVFVAGDHNGAEPIAGK
ncbi:unnamed protein product [Microthlaspi erraticum]|uniref:CCHC-type domain-containing protein n=1 Tax=Microthlaspi erraticum TaxID=1685480 RepID=A0A6D2IE10_9BRAS|nr:unnamed protein product [Microthlaspi erraticum]